MKVPEFALSAAHLRTRPELVARYLIKFIFPEDVLVRSNVYGGMRRGIQALDHNKISALRGEISEQRHCSLSTISTSSLFLLFFRAPVGAFSLDEAGGRWKRLEGLRRRYKQHHPQVSV